MKTPAVCFIRSALAVVVFLGVIVVSGVAPAQQRRRPDNGARTDNLVQDRRRL